LAAITYEEIACDILRKYKEYRSLLEKSKLIVSSYRRAHYAILSRSGFTEKMISTAKREKILLIRGDKLYVG